MKVYLLSVTPVPEVVVATAGRVCYSQAPPEDIWTLMAVEKERVEHQLEVIHESCFEHAVFTFTIEGISRDCTHQLVRHRLASFSQQSQRYCKCSGDDVYRPDTIAGNTDAEYRYYKLIDEAFNTYDDLLKMGIPKEDARYVLPGCTLSNIVVTMNARELRHFFGLRCCRRAQDEIRELADEMLRICKNVSPSLFKNAGAQCVSLGYCPEQKCCGKAPRLDDLRNVWIQNHMEKSREAQ